MRLGAPDVVYVLRLRRHVPPVGHALTIVVDGRFGERARGRVADIAGTVVTGSRSGTLGPTKRSETVLGASRTAQPWWRDR